MTSDNLMEQLKLEAQKARHAQAMRSHRRPATMNSAMFNEPKRVLQEDGPTMTQIHNVLGNHQDFCEGRVKGSVHKYDFEKTLRTTLRDANNQQKYKKLSPVDADLTKDNNELDKIIAEMTGIRSPITAILTPEKIKNPQPPFVKNIKTDLAVRPSDEKPCNSSSSDDDINLHSKPLDLSQEKEAIIEEMNNLMPMMLSPMEDGPPVSSNIELLKPQVDLAQDLWMSDSDDESEKFDASPSSQRQPPPQKSAPSKTISTSGSATDTTTPTTTTTPSLPPPLKITTATTTTTTVATTPSSSSLLSSNTSMVTKITPKTVLPPLAPPSTSSTATEKEFNYRDLKRNAESDPQEHRLKITKTDVQSSKSEAKTDTVKTDSNKKDVAVNKSSALPTRGNLFASSSAANIADPRVNVDFYFQAATKVKHEGNKKRDAFEKAYLYMRSVFYYVLCGIAMEKSHMHQESKKMFYETLKLLDDIGYFRQYPQESKLTVLRLLLMSAIYKKLYDLNKKVADNLRQALDEHYKQYSSNTSVSTTAQFHTPSPRPNSNISTPSSRSTPSPSGSIDSIRSQGSSTSANTTTSCSSSTSSCSSSTTPPSSINSHSSSVTNVSTTPEPSLSIPKNIHSVTRNYVEIMDYIAKAHLFYDQAAIQMDNCKDFVEILNNSQYKTISLHSSLSEHLVYLIAGLKLLQKS